MCDFMKEFESVHSHFYSSAQSKMNLKCKRGRRRGGVTRRTYLREAANFIMDTKKT